MKVYRHPETLDIKQVDERNDVQVAAVKKLGYLPITGEDIEKEDKLSVTYEPVAKATKPTEPAALPRLTKPVPPGPTRDTSTPPPATPGAITREDVAPSPKSEDVEPLKDDKK